MSNVWRNKVVLITGGGSGFGRSLAHTLSALGAKVLIAELDYEKGQQIHWEILQRGYFAKSFQVDVTKVNQLEGLIYKIVQEYGCLDYLFNSTSINIIAPASDLFWRDWDHVLTTNLKSTIYGCQIAAKVMRKQGFGHIINISSAAGCLGFPTAIAYSTSKAAIDSYTQTLGAELKPFGIYVSLVRLGVLNTDLSPQTPVIHISMETYARQVLPRVISSDLASKAIVRAIARKKSEIIFPRSVKIFLFLARWFPALGRWFRNSTVKKYHSQQMDSPMPRLITKESYTKKK